MTSSIESDSYCRSSIIPIVSSYDTNSKELHTKGYNYVDSVGVYYG